MIEQDRVSTGCVELRVLARTSQLRARRFFLPSRFPGFSSFPVAACCGGHE